jgi:hypothetical protein
MKTYEAWQDPEDDSILLATSEGVARDRAAGHLGPGAQLLYRFEAATHEEASAIHALRMGWAPYRPLGPATPCPACGALLYAEGSGECWRCGRVAVT